MNDLSDQFKYAFKDTVRCVKKGYRFTKKALKDIPTDSFKPRKTSQAKSNNDVRHSVDFKDEEEGLLSRTDVEMEGSENSEMINSLEDPPLTDDQVELQVDLKYFDPTYDGVAYELAHFTPLSNNEASNSQELDRMEARILDLQKKCAIVSTTLEKRVLMHYAEFVEGIEGIYDVEDSLLQISSDCKKARAGIRRSKATAAAQVALLGLGRRRKNIVDSLNLVQSMSQIISRRNQFNSLISCGKLIDAMRLLHQAEEDNEEVENRLLGVPFVKKIIEEWRSCQKKTQFLEECVEVILDKSLTHRFVESTYRNLVESATGMVGKTPSALGNQIAQLLWCIAAQILTKSLHEISQLKDESAPIASLAEAIEPKHLLLCFCQMAAKLLDFFHMYARILHWHRTESTRGDSELCEVHAAVLCGVRDIGHRIGGDLLHKLLLAITHARVEELDLTRGLHLFVVMDMLLEGVKITGVDLAELETTTTQTRERLTRIIARQFQRPKAMEVVWWMMEDGWGMSDLSALSLNVVRAISTKPYLAAIRSVRDYLDSAQDEGESGEGRVDNPFYAAEVIDPPDLREFHQTETFGQYWARVNHRGGEGSLCGSGVCGPSHAVNCEDTLTSRKASSGACDFPGRHPNTNGLSASTGSDTLAGGNYLFGGGEARLSTRISMPPTVLTASAMTLCNTLTESAARVVIRYPPLADEMIRWTGDLIGLFLYIIADNFVSISKNVPIERQAGVFSPSTQVALEAMRSAAEAALGPSFHLSDSFTGDLRDSNHKWNRDDLTVRVGGFPPRVWGRLRGEFASGGDYFAVVDRVVACESCAAVVFHQEAFLCAIVAKLSASQVNAAFRRLRGFYTAAMEVLHVGIYRVCQAIYPMEDIAAAIAKLRPRKDDLQESPYVKTILSEMKRINDRRPVMPTPVLEAAFLQRWIFTVQATLVREYSKLSKRKLNGILVMQIQIDVQNFQEQVAAAFGRHNVVFPDYIVNLIKTGFYLDNREKRLSWLPLNHTMYFAADLVNWLSGGDRGFKEMLENILQNELNHHDTLPMEPFIH
ncbi:unnamed protein product [Phytomonas sp. Hart1]|nr:unnamed protein product [Phytomonas sp. Hart1]|eukprot:CCW65916.1 unnamed protein product [Phytomonas sp. isolate Hart1]